MTNPHGPYGVGYRRAARAYKYIYIQNDAKQQCWANHENMLMYELRAGIRPHEAGIPSNRTSARCGEIHLLGVLTARHGTEGYLSRSNRWF